MKSHFYALNHAKPTLTVSNVRIFDVWSAMTDALAAYYDADEESFDLVEAAWSGSDEYAQVVRLDGRMVGALDRPLSQADLAAIWGVDRVQKRALLNRIRSLYNIEGVLLRELTREEQAGFLRDPVGFFLNASEAQSDVIMREIEARQNDRRDAAASDAVPSANKRQHETVPPAAAKAARAKKRKLGVAGQGEMLLPIAGGKIPDAPVASAAKAPGGRRAS